MPTPYAQRELNRVPSHIPISVRAAPQSPAGIPRGRVKPAIPLGPRFSICYADVNGECTERTVHLYAVPKRDAVSFRALCEMRGADRVFKIDRVQWIALGDGSRVDAPTYLEALRKERPPRRAPAGRSGARA